MLPLCLGTRQSSALELGVAFSGGVFIAAGFCHLLPDATEALSDAMGIDYPVAPLLCSLGMLAMLIIDQLTTRAIAKRGAAPAPVRLSDEDEAEPADHAPGDEVVPLLSSGLIPSIILFSALSFHSLMAGLSLGVSDHTAWAIFISILAHKAFAAFALGASFVRHLAVSRRTIACWMLAFSVTTPTGVMLGTALTTVRARGASNGSRYATAQAVPPPSQVADNALTGALTAVAAGTFLHVGLIEVAQRELAKAKHVCGSMLMLLLGFSLMALLALWV